MPDYAEMATPELIDLLFKEEDRAPLQHIEELVRRGEEAAAPLREILRDEGYWYEGQGGRYWIVVHALAVVCAMKDEQALPDLIEMVPHAYFSNHEDAIEILPAALAKFGEKAVEPFIEFIDDHRGAFRDNPDYSHCRHDFSAALTRIALQEKTVHRRVADYLCNLFTDPEEDDVAFLSFSAAHPIALDRERGIEALQAAYQRGAISEAINGRYKDFVKSLDDPGADVFHDLETDLFDFYNPQAIRERQIERAARKEEPLYWGIEKSTPTRYAVSPEGEITRPEKVGRNDPCSCGSGKKYKKCCGAAE
jgi:hypothetical protein